jgi:NAD(P)-dependent dehydrogenase (short-subunit alcohol dehydrogenase family)
MALTNDHEIVVPGLRESTIVISGGASGIGRAAAILAARSGARVVAGDRNGQALAELSDFAAHESLQIIPFSLEVTDETSVREFIKLGDEPGDLKGVVCAAGIAPDKPALEMSLAEWNQVLAVNLTGIFLVAREAARVMVRHGGGSIVTVSGSNAVTGAAGLSHYTASKAGVIALTKSLALELGCHQVRANSVSPGAVGTPLYWSRLTPDESRARVAKYPLARLGHPDDIAHAIGFLLSSMSPWITGQTIHVNGGMVMA